MGALGSFRRSSSLGLKLLQQLPGAPHRPALELVTDGHALVPGEDFVAMSPPPAGVDREIRAVAEEFRAEVARADSTGRALLAAAADEGVRVYLEDGLVRLEGLERLALGLTERSSRYSTSTPSRSGTGSRFAGSSGRRSVSRLALCRESSLEDRTQVAGLSGAGHARTHSDTSAANSGNQPKNRAFPAPANPPKIIERKGSAISRKP